MTAAPAKAKQKRRDVYRAKLTIDIPIDMTDAASLASAIKAVGNIKPGMPDGSTVTVTASMAKV